MGKVAIASSSDLIAALTIGLEDYTADLGVVKTPDGSETAWARSRLVNAARAAGVQAIDSVFGDVGDEEGLLRWGERARGMGFVGMGCTPDRSVLFTGPSHQPSQSLREPLGSSPHSRRLKRRAWGS